jgi:UTP--glucose-1-phosphate uridylyltransferase
LGDTIIEGEEPCTKTLIDYAEQYDTATLSLERVPWADVPKYGVAAVDDEASADSCFPVTDFVEKPSQKEAPSNLAITGRYVFTADIFERLEQIAPGVGGELQLTDAIRQLDDVRGVELSGDRYDIGNIPGWLQANIEMALTHNEGEMNQAVRTLIEDYSQ